MGALFVSRVVICTVPNISGAVGLPQTSELALSTRDHVWQLSLSKYVRVKTGPKRQRAEVGMQSVAFSRPLLLPLEERAVF